MLLTLCFTRTRLCVSLRARMISCTLSNILETSDNFKMWQAILAITILLTVTQAQQATADDPGTCKCKCCMGNQCKTVDVLPFTVYDCASCTRQTCSTVFSQVCPSNATLGRTKVLCVHNAATTSSLGVFVAIASLVAIMIGRE